MKVRPDPPDLRRRKLFPGSQLQYFCPRCATKKKSFLGGKLFFGRWASLVALPGLEAHFRPGVA